MQSCKRTRPLSDGHALVIDGTDYVILETGEVYGHQVTRREWLGGRPEWCCSCEVFVQYRVSGPPGSCRQIPRVSDRGPSVQVP